MSRILCFIGLLWRTATVEIDVAVSQHSAATISACGNWSLPKRPSGLGSNEDGCGHVARTPYRHSERCRIGHRTGRVLEFVTFDARLDVVSLVTAAADRLAVRIRSAGRRCAHGARPDLPDTLLAHRAAGKPIGVVRQERLPAADGAGHRADAGTRHVRQSAAGYSTQSGRRGAAAGPAAAPDGAQAEGASHRRSGQRAAAPAALRWIAVPAATGAALATAPLETAAPGQHILDRQGFIRHNC